MSQYSAIILLLLLYCDNFSIVIINLSVLLLSTRCDKLIRFVPLQTLTYVQTHTIFPAAMLAQLLPPIELALGCIYSQSTLVQTNPPGAGLATHRRTIQISWRDCRTKTSTITKARHTIAGAYRGGFTGVSENLFLDSTYQLKHL